MAEISVFKMETGTREGVASYHIAVALDGYGRIQENKLLTPTCASELEWDTQINLLMKRLEELRIEGKEFLR